MTFVGGRGRCRRVPWLWVALAILAACGKGADPVLPVPPPVVAVEMTEYRFDYEGPIPSGRVVFRVHNAGRVEHRLSILPLGEDFPPIDEQLRGTKRRAVSPYAGVPNRRPGERGTFAVDLVAGRRYAMICLVVDTPDGQSHALKGMTSEFRAGRSSAPSPTTRVPITTALTTTTPPPFPPPAS